MEDEEIDERERVKTQVVHFSPSFLECRSRSLSGDVFMHSPRLESKMGGERKKKKKTRAKKTGCTRTRRFETFA